MAYFPFFIDIKNKKCVLFGGGLVAYRKVEALLEFEANITVIAPRICEELKILADRITIIPREYRESDLEEAFFVIAATNDNVVNSAIAKACEDRKLLINVVDVLENCNFLFPAYIKQGDVSIGITTSGKSPVMARYIKKKIKGILPNYYKDLVDILGGYRDYVKNRINNVDKRSVIFKELADIGINQNGKLAAEDVESVIRKQEEDERKGKV